MSKCVYMYREREIKFKLNFLGNNESRWHTSLINPEEFSWKCNGFTCMSHNLAIKNQ